MGFTNGFAEFGDKDFNPKTLIAGLQQNQTLDFQEQVRKAVVAAEESGRDEEFKLLFTDIDFLPPVTPPNNVIAFGRNYEDHASELNHEVDSLYVFTKAASSLTGDEATIPNHKDITEQLDYEGELGIVIGKSGEKIPRGLALDYIYGYTIINDITDRTAQSSHDQAFLSKSLTGACPMGPYIVTKDELPAPENVNIVTKVNNEIRQDGNTGEMILKIDELIERFQNMWLYIQAISLQLVHRWCGCWFTTTTILQPGDEVKVTIDNIGTLTTYISKN